MVEKTEKEPGTRILLVRHCEAEGNVKRLFQGHTDAPVSENGRKQLDLLAVRLRNQRIDALYSSPLQRAYQTAEAINRFHHLPIHTKRGLMEICGGSWEGKPWADFPVIDPRQSYYWDYEPHKFSPQGGETMQEVYGRVWEAVLEIVKENPGKTVCVTSHGCAIRNLLCRAAGYPIEQLGEVDWCDNTAISIIDFDRALQPRITVQNDASHLSAEVSTFAKQDWWHKEKRIPPEKKGKTEASPDGTA